MRGFASIATASILALTAAALPTAALADSDAPVLTVTGVVAVIADGEAGASASIITGNSVVPVAPDAVAGLATGTKVRASLEIPADTVRDLGLQADVAASSALGEAVVDDVAAPLDAESVNVIETAAAETTAGAHEVDIAINTGKTGGVTQPTADEVRAAIAEASAYFVANTGGAFPGLHVRQVITYTSDLSCGSTYSDEEWAAEAAGLFGRSLEDYVYYTEGEHLVMVGECRQDGKAAVGTVGASLASGGFVVTQADFFTYSIADDYFSGLLAHEFGHNFSLGHSNAPLLRGCTITGIALYTDITTCGIEEYADDWSIMGYATPIHGAPLLDIARRARLGVTTSASLATQSGVTARVYSLKALGADGGLKGVKMSVASGTYFVEYRDGTGEPAAFYLGDGTCAGEWEPSATCVFGTDTITGEGPGVRVLRATSDGATRVTAVRTRSDKPGFAELGLDAGDRWMTTTGDATMLITAAADGTATVLVTTGKPSVGGTVRVGGTATATAGSWPEDFTLTYQWLRNGSSIAGADGPTYAPVDADYEAKLSVRVTGSREGTGSASVTSAAVVVEPGALSATTPVITGAARVSSTLTAVRGAWTEDTAISYRWYVNGSPVSGAVKSTFTVPASAAGKRVTVAVTGDKVAYASKTVTSASVGVPLVGTSSITGKAKARQTLSAHHGVWTTGTAFTYQWYAGGVPIAGATKSTYWVQSATVGKTITVRITGTKTGFTTAALTSAPTKKVTW